MSASPIDPDNYDRVAKLLIDSGEATGFKEAERILASYRLALIIGREAAADPAWQAAALTIVNAGRRAVHGGVSVVLEGDAPCRVPLHRGQQMSAALLRHGASVAAEAPAAAPTIVLGHAPTAQGTQPVLHARAGRWTAGVSTDPTGRAEAGQASVPAAVMAGAIAVSECFQRLRGNPVAAERSTGVSLWQPELPWLSEEAEGPAISELPGGAWLLGLGHLGQAYAWLLGLLPYPPVGERALVLQDDDRLRAANRATSMLHTDEELGVRKTRLVARALCELGWDPRLIEHRHAGGRMSMPGDPSVLLCGLDNPDTRGLLDDSAMPVIIDAGLGAGPQNHLAMAIRRLPASRPSREIWRHRPRRAPASATGAADAYEAMARESGDRCGVEQLAGRTVATAFVGVTAACWAIGGLLRELHGGARYELIDYTLRDPGHVRAIRSPDTRPPRVATVPIAEHG